MFSFFMRLLVGLGSASILFGCSPAQEQGRGPNIILIYADDLGYGDVSANGAVHIRTPNFDRLAQEGMSFTDAHSPSAVCTPSRYATLTGRYAWRTWMRNWVLHEHMPLLIETDRLTLPRLLKGQGYVTGAIGKWHLGWGTDLHADFSGDVSPGPLEVGFDEFFGVPFSHNSSLRLQNFVRGRRIEGLQEGDDIDDPVVQQRLKRRMEDTAIELSAEAVDFIRRHSEEPFFLYYPTTNIHFPVTPNERFQGESDAGLYGDFVAEWDWAIGEILDTLEELDLMDNTVVIATSDNGGRPDPPIMGEKGHNPNAPLRGTKRMIWEGGHRVPMAVRWPGRVEAGAVSNETICHTDLLPTLAAFFERALPDDSAEDGYNILPVLFGDSYPTPLREATVHHSVNGMFAIRKGDWKLIEGDTDGDYRKGSLDEIDYSMLPMTDPESGEFIPFRYDILDYDAVNPVYRLYNLASDPVERTDLAASRPETVRELTALLNRYRDTGRSAPLTY